jgi:hypothetical protein
MCGKRMPGTCDSSEISNNNHKPSFSPLCFPPARRQTRTWGWDPKLLSSEMAPTSKLGETRVERDRRKDGGGDPWSCTFQLVGCRSRVAPLTCALLHYTSYGCRGTASISGPCNVPNLCLQEPLQRCLDATLITNKLQQHRGGY